MPYNDLPTTQEMQASPEPEQPGNSPAAAFAKFLVYLIAGIFVIVITALVFLFG